MKDYIATIIKNEQIAENIYAVTFALDEDFTVRAGQFGNISVGGTHLLRRPIAICKVEGREVTFCYQIKGEGTQKLKTMEAGTKLNVLMPLGNGFYVEENETKVALVGGGVGVFPLISVLRQYKDTKEISAYIGYRNKGAVCGIEEFAKAQKYCIIMGDFNPENRVHSEIQNDGDSVAPGEINMYRVDWAKFSEAGLLHANGGEFGTYGTIMRNGAPATPYPWDNIVVTPNIKILHAEVFYRSWMNDHAIVAADIEIE